MQKKYPTDEKTSFILCEDIRQETGNKVSFLGVYGGRNIIFRGEGEKVQLPSLAFVFSFLDGEGEFNITFSIINSKKDEIFSQPAGILKKKLGKIMNVYLKVSPFAGKVFGKFSARLKLDEKTYERTFELNKS